eukprot:SAG31_NODE_854_length_11497_cov_8.245043_5_plen_45_part_00
MVGHTYVIVLNLILEDKQLLLRPRPAAPPFVVTLSGTYQILVVL